MKIFRTLQAWALAALIALAPVSLAFATTKTIAITQADAPTSALTGDVSGLSLTTSAITFNNGLTTLPVGTFISGSGIGANTYVTGACTGTAPTLTCPLSVSQAVHTAVAITTLYGFQMPSDFSSTNTFHCLGAGGDGGTNGTAGAGGGGSGAYAFASNVALTANTYYPFHIGIHGGVNTATGSASTWFNNTAAGGTTTSGACGARGGASGSGASAGGAGSVTGGTGTATAGAGGGSGGTGTRGGGGGAGAPGPDGAGVAGATGSTGTYAGFGGNADAANAANGPALGGTTPGAAGGVGSYFALTAGGTVGFGGGGAAGDKSGTVNGSAGGLYGAGGGGAGPSGTAGAGVQGVIVISYTTATASSVCTLAQMGYGKC